MPNFYFELKFVKFKKVENMFDVMFDGIARMLVLGFIAMALCAVFALYEVGRFFFHTNTIESHKKIVPTWKLHTDGKKVDTI